MNEKGEAGPAYDVTRAGYTCRQCGANYLARRPWRLRECPTCWWEYLPGRVLFVLASFFAGLATSLLISRLLGYW